MTTATPTSTLLPGLGHREVSVGGGASYLPLEFAPGTGYTELFDFLDSTPDSNLPVTARLKAGPPQHFHVYTVHVPFDSNGSLLLNVDGSITAQLFALAQMDREPVGEWILDIGLPTAAGPSSVLARGPIYFRRRPDGKRAQTWLQVRPDDKQLEIILRGDPKGEYQDGISYKQGDMVTMGGSTFIALCNTDGSPGTGPSGDPSDPNSNTLWPESFPPGSTTMADDDGVGADAETAPAGEAMAPAGGTA